MRVGIIIEDLDNLRPTIANFEQSILLSLGKLNHDNEIVIFTFSKPHENNLAHKLKIKFVNVKDFEPREKFKKLRLFLNRGIRYILEFAHLSIIVENFNNDHLLNKALKYEKIDLVWQPFCMYDIDLPYILNCLDVNYRVNSFLPEERLTAKEWKNYNINRTNIIQRATFLVTSTYSGKSELMRYFNVDDYKIKRIPFFTPKISEVEFAGTQNEENNTIKLPQNYLFYPARIIPHKNHITVLLALKHLKDVHKVVIDFVFVGYDRGNLKYILAKVEELGLTKNVHYRGLVSFKDLNLLYKNAFALVYPSINGPDNLPPLEAFDNGCPVIASRLSGSDEQLGECALLFEKYNYIELADHILKLIKDESLRTELILKGKLRANSFTSDDYVRELLNIIEEYKTVAKLWDGANYEHNW